MKHVERAEAGFVLPFALAAIAALAIISAAAYAIIEKANGAMAALVDDAALARAFATAEAEAVFIFMTSANRGGGVDPALDPQALALEAFGIARARDEEISEPAPTGGLWSAAGGARASHSAGKSVRVIYRDILGFAPINAMNEGDIERFLQAGGIDGAQSQRMAARIADYRDIDAERRFQGAERADYRLYGVPIPSDAPFRSYEELSSVLEFSSAASPAFWRFARDAVSAHYLQAGHAPEFAPPALQFLQPPPTSGANAALENFRVAGAISDGARFLLEAQSASGDLRQRAFRVTRRPAAPDRPYRSVRLYDERAVAAAEEYEPAFGIEAEQWSVDGLAPVFEPENGSR